jgi:hypothetical protein
MLAREHRLGHALDTLNGSIDKFGIVSFAAWIGPSTTSRSLASVSGSLQRLIDVGEPGGRTQGRTSGQGRAWAEHRAFANSGGGWLLIGVRDDGAIRGFDVPGRGDTPWDLTSSWRTRDSPGI